jgi:hypothetical protein
MNGPPLRHNQAIQLHQGVRQQTEPVTPPDCARTWLRLGPFHQPPRIALPEISPHCILTAVRDERVNLM